VVSSAFRTGERDVDNVRGGNHQERRFCKD
jgi:hypothetical protein